MSMLPLPTCIPLRMRAISSTSPIATTAATTGAGDSDTTRRSLWKPTPSAGTPPSAWWLSLERWQKDQASANHIRRPPVRVADQPREMASTPSQLLFRPANQPWRDSSLSSSPPFQQPPPRGARELCALLTSRTLLSAGLGCWCASSSRPLAPSRWHRIGVAWRHSALPYRV